MGSNSKNRIIINILIFLSIAFFPWWISLFLAILGLFLFDSFYEIFLFALIVDSFFYVPRSMFFNFHFVTFFAVLLLFFVM